MGRIIANPLSVHRQRRIREILPMIESEIAALEKSSGRFLADAMPQVYAKGAADSLLPFSFSQIHRQAVAAHIGDTYADVLRATTFMREDAKRWVRDTAKLLNSTGYIEGRTPQQLAREFARLSPRAVTAAGLPMPIVAVQYADGSFRSVDTYADMLFRTNTARAYNDGTVRTGVENGVTRYEVIDGGDCGLTSHDDPNAANGTIVTAAFANAHPAAHPNCRRAFAPRPDLDPQSNATDLDGGYDQARDAFSYDPSTTPSQRAAQLEAERTHSARRAGRGPRRPRNELRDAQAAANQVYADAAQTEALAAKTAARDVARKSNAAKASRAAVRKRTRADHGDLLDEFGIDPDMFNAAKKQMVEIRQRVRATAKDVSRSAVKPPTMTAPPKKIKKQTLRGVQEVYPEWVGGSYDWFDALPPAEQKRLRRKWMDTSRAARDNQTAYGRRGPDDVAAEFAEMTRSATVERTARGKVDTDSAVAEWLEATRKIDAADSLAAGRNGLGYDLDGIIGPETELGQELLDRRLDLNVLMQDDRNRAAAELARYDLDELADHVDREGVIADAVEGFTDHLFDNSPEWSAIVEGRAAGTFDADTLTLNGAPLTPDQLVQIVRYDELVPDGLDLDTDDIIGAHSTITHVARRLGLLDDE